MVNQAQVDAIEQLLIAVLKSNIFKGDTDRAFEKASAALMGSNGPAGTIEKTQAANYLARLNLQLK